MGIFRISELFRELRKSKEIQLVSFVGQKKLFGKPMDIVREELAVIGRAFGLIGDIEAYTRCDNGNVNETYFVTLKKNGINKKYVFQKLNKEALKNPHLVMENIDLVTEYMFTKGSFKNTLHYYECFRGNCCKCENYNYDKYCNDNGKNVGNLVDEPLDPYYGKMLETNGAYWRVADYIEGYVYNKPLKKEVVYETGVAFGRFARIFEKYDCKKLKITIPGFHDTLYRYEQFYHAIEEDKIGRKNIVTTEVEWLKSVEAHACFLSESVRNGKLSLRVTHNDTKTNNVIFDENDRAVAIIDLDTVMPGLIAHDYGDAIRYAAGILNQNQSMSFNFELFEQLSDGYLGQVGNILTSEEKATLYLGPFAMTVELAVRYLTDYLQGDIYFVVRDKEDNLKKCRNMIALAKEMLKCENAIKEYIIMRDKP